MDRADGGRTFAACLFLLSMLTLATARAASGQATQPAAAPAVDPTGTDDTIEAGEADAEAPRRRLIRWNEYEGPFFTIRVGAGVLYDYAAFSQDEESKQQLQLASDHKLRDGRILLKGRLKFKRPVTWSSGLMYDGATDSWLARETGIMVDVPEIRGHLFVGRTKEGFSLNKVMVGYAGWTMERATINDATIPILAAVVSWLLTGETHAYNTRGGFFNQVSPARTVFEGGPGAWELVGRVSYIDLDSGALRGGRFWITPMVNWYLSDQVRFEIAYGYGVLNRFNVGGATHFFQSRLQVQL